MNEELPIEWILGLILLCFMALVTYCFTHLLPTPTCKEYKRYEQEKED